MSSNGEEEEVDRDLLPWPEANARVGDKVWFRTDPLTDWQTDWYVAAVGVTVTEGQRFDIEIRSPRLSGDQGLVVSPFPPAHVKPYEGMVRDKAQILVIPRPVPADVTRVLQHYPDLLAVRDGGNNDGVRLRLLCRRCWCWLIVVCTTVTTGDLSFTQSGEDDDGCFAEQNPDLASTETRVTCGCDQAVYGVRFRNCLGIEEEE